MNYNKIIILENQNLSKYLSDRLELNKFYNKSTIECWNLLPIINNKLFNSNLFRKESIKINKNNKFENIFSFKILIFRILKFKKKKFFYANHSSLDIKSLIIDLFLRFKGGVKFELISSAHNLKINYYSRVKSVYETGFFNFVKFVANFLLNKFYQKIITSILPKSKFIFAGNNYIYKNLKKLKKNVYKINSPEFDYYLKSNLKIKKTFLVYIDQNMTQSFDELVNNTSKQIYKNIEYQNKLDKCLNDIRKIKKLKKYPLVFAAHPRRSQTFTHKHYKILFGQTLKLISKSSLVIGHTSLALKYAILFDKPIFLLDAYSFFNSENVADIAFLKSKLGLKKKDISDSKNIDINSFKRFHVNKLKYNRFKKEYINFPNMKNYGRWNKITSILMKYNENHS